MGRKISITRLSFDDWNDLIERWNERPRDEMAEQRALCLQSGHDWALAPIGMLCCKRCLDYIHPEDQ
jgi:hypothetical protein